MTYDPSSETSQLNGLPIPRLYASGDWTQQPFREHAHEHRIHVHRYGWIATVPQP